VPLERESVPSAESALRSRALLAERVAVAADAVGAVPARQAELFEAPRTLPRCLVTTGIGTSEGHARHLAEVVSRWLGQPARFASTGSLVGSVPPGADRDWLVVFSQGLSANARYALRHAEAWGGVVLVTGLPRPGTQEAAALDAEKRSWLENLAGMGVVQIEMGCGPEYGLLIRVIGARVGYAIGWSLARTLAARRHERIALPEYSPEALRSAQGQAAERVADVFPDAASIATFFDPARELLLVGEGGSSELADQLSLKISEGMLRPQARSIDVLGFAHGPLQTLDGRPASILYVAGRGEGAEEGDWIRRLEAGLDPDHHWLRVLRPTLAWPFAVLEHEAMVDVLLLRALDHRPLDLVDWPGADREGALYRQGPASIGRRDQQASVAPWRSNLLEDAVWPELEELLAGGRGTAILPLGSTEQHGPHLPFGTDTWIGAALAEALAARIEDSVALPPLAFGCASEHMGFPGTLHVAPATLEALLGDLLDALSRHGFERAFVFSAHGGNVAALEAMRDRLVGRVAPLALHLDTDLAAVAALQRRAVEAAGLDPSWAGPHAGEYETSLVAGLHPDAVRREACAPGRRAAPGEAQSLFYPSLRANAERGVLGDPSLFSAERAPAYLEIWVDRLEAVFRSALTAPPEKKRQ